MHEVRSIDYKLIGTAGINELEREGWVLDPAPWLIERNSFGTIRHIFWIMRRRIDGGNGGECDLTDVWDILGEIKEDVDAAFVRIHALEQSGGGTSGMTREIDVEIYSDDVLLPPGAIKRAKGFIKDEVFAAYFTIDDGAEVPEGVHYYIVPSEGPSGYAAQFLGTATFVGGSHGDVIHGISCWGKTNGKWAVRMQSPNYDIMGKILDISLPASPIRIAGGDAWWGKRFPLVVRSDTIRVTIPIP